MIGPKFSLGVQVTDKDGMVLKKAIVKLSYAYEKKAITLEWSDRHAAFILLEADPGFYQFTVSCRGFETQKRSLTFEKMRQIVRFCLGKKGDLYIYRDGARIPLSEQELRIGALVKKDKIEVVKRKLEAKSRSKQFDRGLTSSIEVLDGRLMIKVEETASRKEIGRTLKQLREDPNIIVAGFILHREGALFSLALPIIIVELQAGVSLEILENLARESGAKGAPEHIYGSLYRIRYPEDFGFEILEAQEKLSTHPSIIWANLEESGYAKPDTIIPNDFHWPSQWDKHLMELGDAWQQLNDNVSPDVKFGSPKVLLGIVDTGVQTDAGDADSPDLNGYLTNEARGETNVLLNVVTSLIPINDVSGFAIGHQVSIGEDRQLTIISISGNSIEIGPLRFSHQA